MITGAAFENEAGTEPGQMSALVPRGFERGRLAAHLRSRGRVTLKFRVSAGTARYYRWLERLYERHRPGSAAGCSFLHFLCAALIDSWRHGLAPREAYAHIYARDRRRCTSPVCDRRDLTPHHLRFRSAGGDDSDENVISLCVSCHLEGIHGGRLSAVPPASDVEWRIGRIPHTVVRGRVRSRLLEGIGRAVRDQLTPAVTSRSLAREAEVSMLLP